MRRPSSSTFSNDFSSEAARPNLSYFTYSIYKWGELIFVFFYFDRIRTLVAMATYASHRLITEKVKIASFCCLVGDI